jgi:hypothetical protein
VTGIGNTSEVRTSEKKHGYTITTHDSTVYSKSVGRIMTHKIPNKFHNQKQLEPDSDATSIILSSCGVLVTKGLSSRLDRLAQR